MTNAKTLKSSFIAKFFSGFLFIVSTFIALFSFVCILLLTNYGAFDSSKDASIISMRNALYSQVSQNYCYDALNLCVYGGEEVSIFDDTNFRFSIVTKEEQMLLTNRKSSDGRYIYQTSFEILYPVDIDVVYQEEIYDNVYPDEYVYQTCTMIGYVDGNFDEADQFYLIEQFINIIFDMRFVIIFTCILTIAAAISSFVFLMCAAGYHENLEKPRLSWFDRIPLELIACVLFMLLIGELYIIDGLSIFSMSMVIWGVFIALFDTTLLLLVCMSIASRIRCKSFFKTTLVYIVLKGIWIIIKKTFMFFVKVLSYIPSIWQVILAIGIICIGELILIVGFLGIEDAFFIMVLEKIVLIPVVLYIAVMFKKLEDTTEKIASGDMSAKVNTAYFAGTLKTAGENLNRIQLGISQAVNDKMKSERFKTELITNVSHDIKTPLTSIINYVDLLDKEDLQNETAKEYIQIISKHSDRLKKLVVDLVDLSKASSGVINLDMQPLKIDVLLEQIAGEYSERLASNHLELILRKPEDSMEIMADGQRIYRVFDNLMNNIYKYALPGTRVYLLLEKINNQAVISFKNISASELDMSANDLMERFVRGDSSRNTEGSGLGLSIAESLVSLQNGKFHIQLDGDLFKIILSFPVIE